MKKNLRFATCDLRSNAGAALRTIAHRKSKILNIVIAFMLCAAASASLADSVRTLDGKIYEGSAKIDPAGGILVTFKPGTNPPTQRVDFSQLLRARFDVGGGGDASPFDAWTGNDIGVVSEPGSHKFNRGLLTIEAAGTDIGGKNDSFRYVNQTVTGDAEVVARINPGGQPRPSSVAGVMMRANAHSASSHAALLLTRDNKLHFVVRARAADDTTVTLLGNATAPIWLRLSRQSGLVIAFKSTDGKQWTRLMETRPWLEPDMLAGIAVASRDAGLCAAVFQGARVAADVPAGATIDPLGKPKGRDDKGAQRDGTGVLYVNNPVKAGLIQGAMVEARFALDGKYQTFAGEAFITDRDKRGGSVTLQVFADDEKLFDTGKMSGESASQYVNVPIAGKRELRILAIDDKSNNGMGYNNTGFRNARLQTLSSARAQPKSQSASIQTSDGGYYSGLEIRDINPKAAQFSRGDRRDLSIPLEKVTRVMFPAFAEENAARLPANGTGVMLPNGDFYEGDIERFADGKVQVNSVIFGPREFKLRDEITALVLRPTATTAGSSAYAVQATDGSVFVADALAPEANGRLSVTDRNLGKVAIDPRTIREVRYGGDRLQWLADLRARRIDPGAGRSAIDSLVVDDTPLGSGVQLTDVTCDRAVTISAGTAVSYDLDGHYKTLLSVAGVPTELLPITTAVFVIEADGKEIFRSPARLSLHDAVPVAVDVSGIKTITLKVLGEKDAPFPVLGIWGDPMLVRSAR